MSGDDPSLKRLGVTVVLLIYVLAMNASQAVLLNINDGYNDIMDNNSLNINNPVSSSSDINIDVFGLLGSFFGYFFGGFLLTLSTPGLFPGWMATILGVIYLITLFAFWLIIIDYIKDISILGTNL